MLSKIILLTLEERQMISTFHIEHLVVDNLGPERANSRLEPNERFSL